MHIGAVGRAFVAPVLAAVISVFPTLFALLCSGGRLRPLDVVAVRRMEVPMLVAVAAFLMRRGTVLIIIAVVVALDARGRAFPDLVRAFILWCLGGSGGGHGISFRYWEYTDLKGQRVDSTLFSNDIKRYSTRPAVRLLCRCPGGRIKCP